MSSLAPPPLPLVRHVRNPLTRVAVGLAPGAAHVLILSAGRTALRPPGEPGDRPAEDGRRLVWRPDGGEELAAEGGARCAIVSIPHRALARALPATPLGERMRRPLRHPFAVPLEDPAPFEELAGALERERADRAPGAELAAEHLAGLLLLRLWRLARAGPSDRPPETRDLAERFVLLVGQHLRAQWRVEDYANALGVSRDRLGAAIRRAAGLTPQAYLHRRLTREAAELLTGAGMTAGEVAYALGFADPAYFSRFFKRMTGESPAAYARARARREAAEDGSYAAWP